MLSICLYFHVHQPLRIKKYRIFDIGNNHTYFDDNSENELNNKKVLAKVAKKSYLPTNKILLQLLKQYPSFHFAFSFSGILLNQLEKDFPAVLESFQELVATSRVELLADTYYHSLAFFYSQAEFEKQVKLHQQKIEAIFDQTPCVLRNTELSYSNDLAAWAQAKGYKGILAEGWDPVLGWRSPNFVYRPKGHQKIKVLLKNYRLSDDVAFRFSQQSWVGWPLTAVKFADWIAASFDTANTINLFMDYETFGEHQWQDTGIFDFLRHLPGKLLQRQIGFKTPQETIEDYPAVGEIDVPHVLTWADTERDLSAWTGNKMQQAAIETIYGLEKEVLASRDRAIIEDWRRLQTSDHFYYMCTKWFADGDVHKYFNPYESPYDAFISYMNVTHDLKLRVRNEK